MTAVEQVELPQPTEPCDPKCPGWGVFYTDGFGEDPDSLLIEACDVCWLGVPDAPSDEFYQQHPTCLAELERERAAFYAQTPVLEGPEECEDNDCAGCAWCDLNLCADCGERTDQPGEVHTCPVSP